MNFTPLASSSAGNAYLVQIDGVAPLLIEAGIPMNKLRVALWAHYVRAADLAGCLISHGHGDHSKAVNDLLKAGVDIYTSPETAAALGISDHHRVTHVETGFTYHIGDWSVLPFDLAHDVPTHGFYIAAPDGERMLFVPDTAWVRNRFSGVTIMALECNHCADILSENVQTGHVPAAVGHRVRRNHTSLETVKKFLLANDLSKCREVWLLHLSDANSSEERMRKEIQQIMGVPVYVAKN